MWAMPYVRIQAAGPSGRGAAHDAQIAALSQVACLAQKWHRDVDLQLNLGRLASPGVRD